MAPLLRLTCTPSVSIDDHTERRRGDTDLLEALDRVRAELRDEIRLSEGRVMGAFESATVTHAGIHATEGESRSIAHARFEDFMRKAELAQARRDGAIGIIRFTVDLVGRNWRGIVALGATVAVLLGNIRVEVVTP